MNLNQVTIVTENTRQLVSFYKKLGLKLIVDALPRYARLECPDGEATLSICFTDDILLKNNTTLYFENDELDSVVNKLQDKGITFSQLPKNESWLWREAKLQDPDGNNIILFKAGENRKNPPWRIN
ncbi:putative glyoxalase superfamily protein PhnB [Lacinutrix venerupis]|uniref:Glyoxalase/bleomycin resistance/extradiol dioxygenase family protein n=1 Tax=Lacinutrix venerupis TaxID=1486034 RepID=A0AAC9PVI9_9FLAO|nr:VOC family protein [Lacinutrix venerupis]APX99661.1 glyoxalase/bleomycin resistance/extradiol dioxygenase family protein [Lacinutrix venerupis]RLJ61148.1 putative glyoxalase superfamily protein PhnB [Lacinutrix venerupis]